MSVTVLAKSVEELFCLPTKALQRFCTLCILPILCHFSVQSFFSMGLNLVGQFLIISNLGPDLTLTLNNLQIRDVKLIFNFILSSADKANCEIPEPLPPPKKNKKKKTTYSLFFYLNNSCNCT